MMSDRKLPIRSNFEDVLELSEAIDRFVIGLAARVDDIQDAELGEKTGEVTALARLLALDAERYGYPDMVWSADRVAVAAENLQIEDLQETVVDLTEIAQRIRLGHRGAA
jgi:hypothetical protein